MLQSAIPDGIPRTHNKFACWLGTTVLTRLGWHISGNFPAEKKFVVIVAPHTSNWDFIIGIAVMLALQLRIRFLGKNSIFVWPFKTLLHRLGGIAVDRSAHHGVVEQMVSLFANETQLILALAPEGTRRKANWKSGFLHIAHRANVPVVPVSLDFAKKEVFVQPAVMIGSDIAQELQQFKQYFSKVCAKNPQGV